ncbi:response regulator [Pararhizobium qamdonense]|uniref:response regulator n=1 Tax=Pararhizobium qamdonense TaxID=3031126 RepID=UPI0023E13B10|nr:response regulator [Pararhizobium qamdonense]
MDHAFGSPSVLIVEDNLLIAMDLEAMLQQLGFTDTVLLPSCAGAKAWLKVNTPAFAVVDIHLKDGSCEEVAVQLAARNIPFIVSSGSNQVVSPPIFARGIRVSKPCASADLAAAVASITSFSSRLSG